MAKVGCIYRITDDGALDAARQRGSGCWTTAVYMWWRNCLRPLRSQKAMTKAEREKTIVEMYRENYSIDDIWRVSGFSSRSSVFRILNKYGVALNRGRFSRPLGPRKGKEE